MDTESILILILVFLSITTILVAGYMKNGSPEKKEHDSDNDFSDIERDYEQLRVLVVELIKKLEGMAISDRDLKNQIQALQSLSGVNREQIKYLTSNVNSLV